MSTLVTCCVEGRVSSKVSSLFTCLHSSCIQGQPLNLLSFSCTDGPFLNRSETRRRVGESMGSNDLRAHPPPFPFTIVEYPQHTMEALWNPQLPIHPCITRLSCIAFQSAIRLIALLGQQ